MADNFKDLPDIATIQPDRLIKYRISEDKFSAEVLLPGLSYTDFDKKIGGKFTLWAILKTNEAIRWSGLMHGFLYYPELCHGTNHTLFIASEKSTFTDRINKMLYDTHFGKHAPMHGVGYLSQVGKSSYTLTMKLSDYKTGEEILTSITKIVYVKNSTRKPSSLPDVFSRNAEKHLKKVPYKTIARNAPLPIPAMAFQYQSKVLHSDCDLNLHVNQSVYLRWCSDAGTVAALGGHFKYFKRHIELYPLKSVTNHYIGEASVNTQVVVNVWEDTDVPRCLHFVITRDNTPIFTLDLEYSAGAPMKLIPHLESKL